MRSLLFTLLVTSLTQHYRFGFIENFVDAYVKIMVPPSSSNPETPSEWRDPIHCIPPHT